MAAMARARQVARVAAVDDDESESESTPDAAAAKIAATLGVTPEMAARGRARERLEKAIQEDDEAALRLLERRYGLDRREAMTMARSLGCSHSELAHAPAAQSAKPTTDRGHYGPAGQPKNRNAYGSAC